MFSVNTEFCGNLQHIAVTGRSDGALESKCPAGNSPLETARDGMEQYRTGAAKITMMPFREQVVSQHPSTRETPWEGVTMLYRQRQINDSMPWSGRTLAALLNVPLDELHHIRIDPDTCHVQHVQRQRDNTVVGRSLGEIRDARDNPEVLGAANTALESYRRNKYLFEQIGVDINDLSGVAIRHSSSTGKYHLYRYQPIPVGTSLQIHQVQTIFNAYTGESANMYRRDSWMPVATFDNFDDAYRCHRQLLDIALAR